MNDLEQMVMEDLEEKGEMKSGSEEQRVEANKYRRKGYEKQVL